MARLIHLNGPSRVGKSTLAHRYADNHPGTLCLDVDVLVGQVDGWREGFSAAFRVATTRCLALAKSHLRGGQDVVVPQLVTIFNEGNPFEAAAAEVGAKFIEVALLADVDEHTRRLREKKPAFDVDARIQSTLETSDLVERIRGHLAEYLHGRPDTIQLDTTGLAIDQTYVRLMNLLGG
ncbi:MAG TPA: AAA family ATPase [Streptosporangiaceae bacterium]|jgi:predicted kinase